MEELRNKIETSNLFDKEDVRGIFDEIYQITDEEKIEEAIDLLFSNLRKKILEGTYSSYDSIKEAIDNIKQIYCENRTLESSEIYQLFNKYNIDTNAIVNEYLMGIDSEISTLESDLSEEIAAAREQNISVVEYIQSEIDKLKDYDERIAEYDRTIEEIKQKLENRNLTDEELQNKIEETKKSIEKWKKIASIGGSLSIEEEKEVSKLKFYLNGLQKEQDKRKDNKFIELTDGELQNIIVEHEKEIEEIKNKPISSSDELSYEETEEALNNLKETYQHEINRREFFYSYEDKNEGLNFESLEEIKKAIEKTAKKRFVSERELNNLITIIKQKGIDSEGILEEFENQLKMIYRFKGLKKHELESKIKEIEKKIELNENRKKISSANELSEDDKKKISELENLIKNLKEEQNKRKDNRYRNLTDEELQKKIEECKQDLRKRLFVANTVDNEMTDEERKLNEEKIVELDKLIKELEAELEKRKKDPLRTTDIKSDRELKEELNRLINERNNLVSEKKNKSDELNNKLNKAKRLDELKNKKENFKAPKKIERKEKNKKLLLKSLIALGGLGTGLVLSSVPGVGVIRMAAAFTKIGIAGINAWTKKAPEGKVASVVKAAGKFTDKISGKFGDMKNKFSEKHPKITAGISNIKNKIKNVLTNKNVNLFVNGVAVGYIVGNLVELFTGETVLEHAKGLFDKGDVSNVVTPGAQIPDKNTNMPSQSTQKPINRPINKPGNLQPSVDVEPNVDFLDNAPIEIPDFDLEVGGTYDLSGLTHGFVSSDATQSVQLMTSAAKNVTLDQIVNGRVHFLQENGLGMAWYDLEEVKEYLAQMAKVAGKGR